MAGHSSTSISAANGLAKAKSLLGKGGTVVAIIGDGALTGGLAYEGLSNAGRSKDRLIVVLNDNGMSISRNVGFIARHLAALRKAAVCPRQNDVQQPFPQFRLSASPVRNGLFYIKTEIKKLIYSRSSF